jgi:hypothetical protein
MVGVETKVPCSCHMRTNEPQAWSQRVVSGIRDRRFGHFRIVFHGRYSPSARDPNAYRRATSGAGGPVIYGGWSPAPIRAQRTMDNDCFFISTHLSSRPGGTRGPARPDHPTTRLSVHASARSCQPDLIIQEAPAVVSPLSAGLPAAVSAEPTRRARQRPPSSCPPLFHAHVSCLSCVPGPGGTHLPEFKKNAVHVPATDGNVRYRRQTPRPFHCIARLVSGSKLAVRASRIWTGELARCDARFCGRCIIAFGVIVR